MRRLHQVFIASAALIAPFAAIGEAQAGIEACGNIHVEASAECEMRGGIECEGYCEPVRFEAQCAANLTAECRGQCDGTFTAECTGSCEASCVGECEADPGKFDCAGSCYADCFAAAQAHCSSGDGECRASAEATCDAECSIRCEAEPPSLDCNAQCKASCEGSCRAEANLECQVDCQASGYADCKSELEGGCKVDCETEAGALFCDGQYVDHGGNLAECVDSLRAIFGIEVEGYAEASCSNNSCHAEAGATISCSFEPSPGAGKNLAAFLGLAGGLLGFGAAVRRRRRR